MIEPITLPPTTSAERSRLLSVNDIRRRALERLYQRREAISSLIGSLEDYQRIKRIREASCVELSAAAVRRCS